MKVVCVRFELSAATKEQEEEEGFRINNGTIYRV